MSQGLGIKISSSISLDNDPRLPHNSNPAMSQDTSTTRYRSQESSTMRLLGGVEAGEAMVQMNSSGAGVRQGQRIVPGITSPGGGSARPSNPLKIKPDSNPHTFLVDAPQGQVSRHGTLLSAADTSSSRTANQLRSLLGKSSGKISSGAMVPPSANQATYTSSYGTPLGSVAFEQARSRVRVEVDIQLESQIFVQGNDVQGSIEIHIPKPPRSKSPILLAGGKVRIVGFEDVGLYDTRHIFYQCSSPLSVAAPDIRYLYVSPPDLDGFCETRAGTYSLPFSFHLPVGSDSKGVVHLSSSIALHYIALVSIQVKDADTGKRSIAHFYRQCAVWPRLNPSSILAQSSHPVTASESKSLFMGGKGRVNLTASLHRSTSVAGQSVCVKIIVTNESKKTIKSTTLYLIRSCVLFKPDQDLDLLPETALDYAQDPDACRTVTSEKQMAECSLYMGQRGAKGYASAKGWWAGVGQGEKRTYCHFLTLPPDALSVSRGRYIEIKYHVRVTISGGTLTSNISVDLPIQVVNFLSLDPPPLYKQSSHVEPTPPVSSLSLRRDHRAYPRAESLFEQTVVDQNHEEPYEDEDEWESVDDKPDNDTHLDNNMQEMSPVEEEGPLHDENTEEFVAFAVNTARVSDAPRYQRSFADLYHLAGPAANITPSKETISEHFSVSQSSSHKLPIVTATLTRPARPRGPSFRKRVEQKMVTREYVMHHQEQELRPRVRETSLYDNQHQEDQHASSAAEESPREDDVYPPPSTSKVNSNDSDYSVTPQPQLEASTADRNSVAQSSTFSTTNSSRGSRVLPDPPQQTTSAQGFFTGTQIPLSRSAALVMLSSTQHHLKEDVQDKPILPLTEADNRRIESRSEVPRSPSISSMPILPNQGSRASAAEHSPSAENLPSTSSHARMQTAISVKDKIKLLEERCRAHS